MVAVPLEECPDRSTSTKALEISGPEVAFSLHELALLSDTFCARERNVGPWTVCDRQISFLLALQHGPLNQCNIKWNTQF